MSLKENIKSVVPRTAWMKMNRFKHEVWRGPMHRRQAQECLQQLGLDSSPPTVQSGPFTGMRYLIVATGSALMPKILGTYEMETAPGVESMIDYDPDLIIDIGSAEGYYAVGMALRCPKARVMAFDTYRRARELSKQLAELNGVGDRVEVRGRCEPSDLESLCAGTKRPAIISDTDGYEEVHLQPERLAGLGRAVILVELHEDVVPGISNVIKRRFEPTHRLTQYDSRERTLNDWPAEVKPQSDDPEQALELMDEGRPQQSWFLLVPKNAGSRMT